MLVVFTRCFETLFKQSIYSKPMSCSISMARRSMSSGTEFDECLQEYNYTFKPDLLKNKVALVTGGGSGIGFRITEIFMRHGCKTAIASRKLERVVEAAKRLEAATGGECLPLQLDVREPAQVEKVIDEILAKYGRLDVLVNNAAGNFLSPASSLSYNAFKTVLEIDTVGTYNVTKAAFQKYFGANGGNVINISATLAYRGNAFQAHAGSAKAAVDALTRHLAVEWGSQGIRVNGIAPGPIEGTEGMRKLGGKSRAASQMMKIIPLQRFGRKTEIADSALYLASDASSYVTGAVIVVDGGAWLTSPNDPLLFETLLKSEM